MAFLRSTMLTVSVAVLLLALQAATPASAYTCADSKCTSCPDSFLKCDACKSGYSPVDFTGSWGIGISVKMCVSSNENGCTTAHCNGCDADNAANCTSCETGYSLYRPGYLGGYAMCLNDDTCIVADCQECDGLPWKCKTCDNDRTPSTDGFCNISTSVCAVTNCASCDVNAMSTCVVCKNGYALRGGKCYTSDVKGSTDAASYGVAPLLAVAAAAVLSVALLSI